MTVTQLKVDELTLDQLDACVAHVEGRSAHKVYSPSRSWADGGPIIERERISVLECRWGWFAHVGFPPDPAWSDDGVQLEYWEIAIPRDAVSPTPLVAAMRAFLVARVGETVELPA